MKALSIKQPWAWLICAGYKDIENRNWRIGRNPRHGPFSTRDVANFRLALPERIYVHAGKKLDMQGYYYIDEHPLLFKEHEGWWAFDRHWGYHDQDKDQYGALIGEVDITDCVTKSQSHWFEGPYGFVLANPKLYDKPIPYRGQLGFFEVTIEANR